MVKQEAGSDAQNHQRPHHHGHGDHPNSRIETFSSLQQMSGEFCDRKQLVTLKLIAYKNAIKQLNITDLRVVV